MKKHLKFITVLLALAICLSLTACIAPDNDNHNGNGNESTEPNPEFTYPSDFTPITTPTPNHEDENLGNPEYSSVYTEGLVFELNEDGKTYKVSSYNGTATEVVIPRIYKGEYVNSIRFCAFFNQSSLKSITIPDSIESLGLDAFYGCDSLAFNEYGNALYLGNSSNPYLVLVKAKDKNIEHYEITPYTRIVCSRAFYPCQFIKYITIPASVTSIEEEAFCENTYVTSISVDSNNSVYKSDGNCLIEKNTNTLIVGCKSSVIPSYVKSIAPYAFFRLWMTNISIPNGVTSIGENAFSGCRFLTGINIPQSVTFIDKGAFSGCEAVTSVTVSESNGTYKSDGNCIINKTSNTLVAGFSNSVIPSYVTAIEESAFAYLTNITSITVPEGVTAINRFAFYCCYSLTDISLPQSLSYIDHCAFGSSELLTNISYAGTKAQWNSIEKVNTRDYIWDQNMSPYTVHCIDGDIAK